MPGPVSLTVELLDTAVAALRVVELSALSAHALLRTSSGSAMSFGEPSDGKLGYAARIAYVSTPRVVEALLGHTIVGVAAGGATHSSSPRAVNASLQAPTTSARAAGSLRETPTGLYARCNCRTTARLVQVCAGHAHTLLSHIPAVPTHAASTTTVNAA